MGKVFFNLLLWEHYLPLLYVNLPWINWRSIPNLDELLIFKLSPGIPGSKPGSGLASSSLHPLPDIRSPPPTSSTASLPPSFHPDSGSCIPDANLWYLEYPERATTSPYTNSNISFYEKFYFIKKVNIETFTETIWCIWFVKNM